MFSLQKICISIFMRIQLWLGFEWVWMQQLVVSLWIRAKMLRISVQSLSPIYHDPSHKNATCFSMVKFSWRTKFGKPTFLYYFLFSVITRWLLNLSMAACLLVRVHQLYTAHGLYALCGQFVSWLSTAWIRQLKQTSLCRRA